MTDKDISYFQRRADEELRAAGLAECPEVGRVHRELAERYMALLQASVTGGIASPPADSGGDCRPEMRIIP